MIVRFLGAQWLAVGFVGAVSFALSIVVARVLGPNLFGVYAIAQAGGTLAAIMMDGGFSKLLHRERSRASPGLDALGPTLPAYAFGHALSMAGILSLLAVVLWPQQALTICAAIWCFAALTTYQIGLVVMRADGRMVREAGWQVGNRTFSAACVLALLAFSCIALMLAVFFVWTYPANQATSNWTTVPANWEELRRQWEYSHAVNALLTLAGFCCVAISVLTTRE